MPHVAAIVQEGYDDTFDPIPLVEYSSEKLQRRVEIITDSEADLPDVDELVEIEGAQPTAAD
jgi:ribonucleoside-diphosphate reductase beta chain